MPRQYESDFAKGKPYTPKPKPRVYEQNLIDPYLRPAPKPRLYETGSAGAANVQPSRLYEQDIINAQRPNAAAARAGQGRQGAGYGPILAQNDPGYNVLSGDKTGSNPNGGGGPGGGGSGGGGFMDEPVVEPEPVDPSIEAQRLFIARLMSLRDETMAGYPGATSGIQGYYDAASKDLADPYNDYYNQARGGAESLGLNFANDDNVKLADLAARKLQENYDLNETTDLATVEKMKSLNTDSFTQMLLAAEARQMGPGLLADQLALEEAALAAGGSGGGGGGGGGRRGGGSGGSDSGNPFSEKATQDEAFFNPGLATAIAGIDDPNQRAYIDSIYGGTGTKPQSALNRAYADLEKFNSFTPPPVTSSKRTIFNKAIYGRQKGKQYNNTAQNAKDKKAAADAVQFFKQWSAGYTPQVGSQKVQTTSTTKNK